MLRVVANNVVDPNNFEMFSFQLVPKSKFLQAFAHLGPKNCPLYRVESHGSAVRILLESPDRLSSEKVKQDAVSWFADQTR